MPKTRAAAPGFLFDEQWRLTATLTAGRSEGMISTCNGLLCFLDDSQGSINTVEPFIGESLALPLSSRHEPNCYCFGFDPGSRRYKIVHKGFQDGPAEQAVHVRTVTGGESWRSVHVVRGAAGEAHRGLACADTAVYWSMEGVKGRGRRRGARASTWRRRRSRGTGSGTG